ncbi:MAG: ATP-dependent DNA helicase RecG [Flavobacteriales bacterium]|jgi:ATP-dependent DNA helicase RecG|nr:ATP-dependent DNA helicase RecG [Flavobacteriales bacterium]
MQSREHLFHTSVEFLKGIGAKRAQLLAAAFGVRKYKDLLQFFPSKYIDKTQFFHINELVNSGAEVQIKGKITAIFEEGSGRKKRLKAEFEDDTGSMSLTWFQGINFVKSKIKIGKHYLIFGKPKLFNHEWQMMHPQIEELTEGNDKFRAGLQAIYPSSEKLKKSGFSSLVISKSIYGLLEQIHPYLYENLPSYIVREQKFLSRKAALFHIHHPKSQRHLAEAKRRLIFEEFYFQQLVLLLKKISNKKKNTSFVFEKVGAHFNHFFKNILPFQLTGAQQRVLKEIHQDMKSGQQMNRMVQGDVGSGKTIVALMSMLLALDNDFQATLMAPTEILAQQHYQSIKEMLETTDIHVRILTGSTKTKERREIDEGLRDGSIHILVGTHAILEDKVVFKNLGISVIDEQHRFGVAQRAKMWKKNTKPPHILIMTATPIPRTLAMSHYGDLDLSVIDELPPGRKEIVTRHFKENRRLEVIQFIRKEIAKGRQVYIVYPLIEENEKMDFANLQKGFEAIIRDFPAPDYSVSIVHGKMKASDKEREMNEFAEGKTDIMVATTVIEVGVNVPNASVMIIESAERFGLSQLHQLRGRVGRGSEQSYCLLMTGYKLSKDTQFRMKTMVETNDGFKISEADLTLRGPGDLMGTRQSGMMDFKIASLIKNREELQMARQYAIKSLEKDHNLSLAIHEMTRKYLIESYKKIIGWSQIS